MMMTTMILVVMMLLMMVLMMLMMVVVVMMPVYCRNKVGVSDWRGGVFLFRIVCPCYSCTRSVLTSNQPNIELRGVVWRVARNCSWTAPAATNIPDSHTRTCASTLPGGQYYMLGSQVYKVRHYALINATACAFIIVA